MRISVQGLIFLDPELLYTIYERGVDEGVRGTAIAALVLASVAASCCWLICCAYPDYEKRYSSVVWQLRAERVARVKKEAIEEARQRILQKTEVHSRNQEEKPEDVDMSEDKAEAEEVDSKLELNNNTNVVYIDKNDLSPQQILNIKNSVVYITSSRSPSPTHSPGHSPAHSHTSSPARSPSLGKLKTLSASQLQRRHSLSSTLGNEDQEINNILMYNLKK